MVEIVDHGEGTRLGAPLVFVLGLKSGPQKTRKSGSKSSPKSGIPGRSRRTEPPDRHERTGTTAIE